MAEEFLPDTESTMSPVPKGQSQPPKYLLFAFVGLFVLLAGVAGGYWIKSEKLKAKSEKLPSQAVFLSPTPTLNPTANWKTYTNTKYKYSLWYPSNLQTRSAVEELPGNEAARNLETTCCVNVTDKNYQISLQINVLEEKRGLSEIKQDLMDQFKDKISGLTDTMFDGQPALRYTLYGNQKSTVVVKNGYEYEFEIADEKISNRILSTFRFLD